MHLADSPPTPGHKRLCFYEGHIAFDINNISESKPRSVMRRVKLPE